MNVYDFDKTLYPRDSEFEFYLELIPRYPALLLSLPRQAKALILMLCKKIDKTACKAAFFSALSRVPDVEREVVSYWDRHEKEIEPYYLSQKQSNDVVISASPEFLLKEIAGRLGIGTLIGSRVDPKTGAYDGKNCHDEEKCARFFEIFPGGEVDAFYSDSFSDTPMAKLAKRAYLIRRHRPCPWPAEKLK